MSRVSRKVRSDLFDECRAEVQAMTDEELIVYHEEHGLSTEYDSPDRVWKEVTVIQSKYLKRRSEVKPSRPKRQRNYKAEYQRRKDLALMRKLSIDRMVECCKELMGLPKPTKAVSPPRSMGDPTSEDFI